MPRPLIGPKVDFRLPEEVIKEVQQWADTDGCAHDALFRDLLLRGYVTEQRRRRREPVGSAQGSAQRARVAAEDLPTVGRWGAEA
jgi:hypothetical protein